MGKAIGYSLKSWQALTRFITNVEIPPDNNRSERSLRRRPRIMETVGHGNPMEMGS
jgi:hypothetical protein